MKESCSSQHQINEKYFVARLPLCREVAQGAQFGTISGLALFYCAVCAGQRLNLCFRAPRAFSPRGCPLGCFFAAMRLLQARGLMPCSRSASTNTFVNTSAPCLTGPRPVQFRDITPLLRRPQGVPRADRRLC